MSCHITNYDLVRAVTIDDLRLAVLDRIAQGWQPLGGMTAITLAGAVQFVQSIVIVAWETSKDTDTNGGKPARLPTPPKSDSGRGQLIM